MGYAKLTLKVNLVSVQQPKQFPETLHKVRDDDEQLYNCNKTVSNYKLLPNTLLHLNKAPSKTGMKTNRVILLPFSIMTGNHKLKPL
jgi:hypothetical protein